MLQVNSKSISTGAQDLNSIMAHAFHGHKVESDGDFINLTDLWKASGADSTRRPVDYLRSSEYAKAASAATSVLGLNVENLHVYTKRGRFHGGTWAHKIIALRYCEWLSQEVYEWATRALVQQAQEEANPELKIARGAISARDKYAKMGKDAGWIDKRLKGIIEYHNLNATLHHHGCATRDDYKIVHGAITKGVTGKTAKQLQQERGVKATRDGLTDIELNLVSVTQMATTNNISKKHIDGCYLIAAEATRISSALKSALDSVLA